MQAEPAERLRDDETAVFLFHGVVEQHTHPVRNYIRKHIDRPRFIEVMQALKAKGSAISMDTLAASRQTGQTLPPRSFVVTFDDGFENNLTVAAPILAGMKVPATFYITTSFVDRNAMSWIDRLEYCIESVPDCTLNLPWRETAVTAKTAAEKIALLDDIRANVKSNRAIVPDELVASVFAQCGMDEVKSSNDPIDQKMNWRQVGELGSEPLFTVGGHSHTHAILAFLDPPALDRELGASFSLLSEHGIGPRHYSYPEGLAHCYSPAVIDTLKKRGVVCCPTAIDGTNPASTSLFDLKRITVL